MYNDLSITSVHNTLDLSKDYEHIRNYKENFSNVIDFFKDKWDILKLPFIYTEPPFSNKYYNYNIVNNSIQIINYNLYLENINTKYIIEFANYLVIDIYNVFKKNIDRWLCNNDYKAYILCQKLISNHITDREIYTYQSIYERLNKKKKKF